MARESTFSHLEGFTLGRGSVNDASSVARTLSPTSLLLREAFIHLGTSPYTVSLSSAAANSPADDDLCPPKHLPLSLLKDGN